MVHFSKIIPSFVFLVLYVFPNTGTYEFFLQNNPISSDLVQTWNRQIVGSFLRYYFVHGYLLFAYPSHFSSNILFVQKSILFLDLMVFIPLNPISKLLFQKSTSFSFYNDNLFKSFGILHLQNELTSHLQMEIGFYHLSLANKWQYNP